MKRKSKKWRIFQIQILTVLCTPINTESQVAERWQRPWDRNMIKGNWLTQNIDYCDYQQFEQNLSSDVLTFMSRLPIAEKRIYEKASLQNTSWLMVNAWSQSKKCFYEILCSVRSAKFNSLYADWFTPFIFDPSICETFDLAQWRRFRSHTINKVSI